MIRLYRNYDPTLEQGPVQLVSAFRGLHELIPMKRGAGVVTDWKAANGTLLIGGDSRVIKTWDAQTEMGGAVSCQQDHYSSIFGSWMSRISRHNRIVRLLRWRLVDKHTPKLS